jgi:anhydro-N-acetylmuramic acid kinase
MTGTSIDGIDAALVEIVGRGLAMRARVVRGVSRSFEPEFGDVRRGLRSLADQEAMTSREIAGLMGRFAEFHVDALRDLLPGLAGRLDLICVHGQTVYHAPPMSWQLMQPAPIARAMGAPVVFDLRAADIAAGGQGAPITPIADWVLYRSREAQGDAGSVSRAVVNLGGFCNVTVIGAGENSDRHDHAESIASIRGLDVCACSQLLDGLARNRLGEPFDRGGSHASRGSRDDAAYADLVGVLERQAASRRSLGTGDESSAWIDATRTRLAQDALRTACDAIGATIVGACRRAGANELILAGGGLKNAALLGAIRLAAASASARVLLSDDVGIPSSHREAVCFAVLGAMCQDRVTITLPAVTGVASPAPIAGAWVFA